MLRGRGEPRHRGDPRRRHLQRHRDRARPATPAATPRTASGSIAIGETKTCTVTNDDKAAEADGDQARDQRQRRHRDGGRLHARLWRHQRQPGNFAGAESRAPRSRWTPAPTTSPRSGPAGYTRRLLGGLLAARSRTARPRPARSPTTTSQPKLTVIKHVINDNGGTADGGGLHADGRRHERHAGRLRRARRPRDGGHARRGHLQRHRDPARPATRRADSADCSRLDRRRRDQDLHGHQRRHCSRS